MLLALILLPFLTGLLCFFLVSDSLRRFLLIATAVSHMMLTLYTWISPPKPMLDNWLSLDDIGHFVLTITSFIFLLCAFYTLGYLSHEKKGWRQDFAGQFRFINAPEARFVGCLLLFLSSMTLVAVVQHLGLLWVAIEATTLASAVLIYYHRHKSSLEATWKYLVICSVGIAIALLGNFAFSIASGSSNHLPLILSSLLEKSNQLSVPWLRAGYIFFLVGYGAKMGLAPMHTWLPDAYSESPSPVSGLMSATLPNCAFLGVFRGHQVMVAAGQGDIAGDLILVLGFFSVFIAAVFIIQQGDFKRLLAYSSVDNMGIIAIGLGVGGTGAYGAILHMINHAFVKGALFLVAGNILFHFRTKSTYEVSGLLQRIPISGTLWIAGVLAILGMPPFGLFVSKFMIIKSVFDNLGIWPGCLLVLLLGIVFIGMTTTALSMAQGTCSLGAQRQQEASWSFLPSAILLVCAMLLSFYIPSLISQPLSALSERSLNPAPILSQYAIGEKP